MILVGDLVECIKAGYGEYQGTYWDRYSPNKPVFGAIYTVRATTKYVDRAGTVIDALRLEEILNPVPPPPNGEAVFFCHWFRTVKKTNIDALKDLIANPKSDIDLATLELEEQIAKIARKIK